MYTTNRNCCIEMGKVFRHILPLMVALLAAVPACTKQEPAKESGVVVEIRAAIDPAPGATKAIITGTDFPNWPGQENDPTGTFGIFSCVHEDVPSEFAAHKPATYNARAYKSSAGWRYHYVSSVNGTLEGEYSNNFVLTQRKDNKTADLYAYAPWTADAWASGPTAIPFETAKQWDWMYAVENNRPYLTPIDANDRENSDLDPTASGLKAAFYFRHVMARLVFRFKVKHTPTNYRITSLSIARTDAAATTHLYTSGTFNAITGTLDGVEGTDGNGKHILTIPKELTVDSTTPVSLSILLAPTAVADDELSFTFTVNGQKLQPFVLKKAFVEHGVGSGVYGLQPGYTYTFNFTLDNYVYFDGFNVSEDWEALELPLPDYI